MNTTIVQVESSIFFYFLMNKKHNFRVLGFSLYTSAYDHVRSLLRVERQLDLNHAVETDPTISPSKEDLARICIAN